MIVYLDRPHEGASALLDLPGLGRLGHFLAVSTDAPGWVALLGCLLVTVGLRALALWRNWQLPAWRA